MEETLFRSSLCSRSVQHNGTKSFLGPPKTHRKHSKFLPCSVQYSRYICSRSLEGENSYPREQHAERLICTAFFMKSSPTAQQRFLSLLSVGGQEQMALETYNRSSLMQCFISISKAYKVQGLPEQDFFPMDILDLGGFFCLFGF